MKVLVTGSNGFIGTPLVAALEGKNHHCVRVVRHANTANDVAIGELHDFHAWASPLSGVDAVIHLAARVHDYHTDLSQLDAYRQTNTHATLRLARAAQDAGVKRFIFLSTLYRSFQPEAGNSTQDAHCRETRIPAPEDAYGISKWEAEQALGTLMHKNAMEIVIIRPPIVYGPQVRANFLRLLTLAASGLPLPLAAIRNQRSMIYVDNLVDAIMRCLAHPAAANQTYVVADDSAWSVPELIRHLANVMDKKCRLLPVPIMLLHGLGALLGRAQDMHRLTESLRVDDSKIRTQLGWKAPFSVEEGLTTTAEWYRNQKPET